MSLDLIFRNARVVDGSGSPWYRADVGVANGRIAMIGHRIDVAAARTTA
jgi:N-acyl-D-amino-acid deacylase